MRFFAGLLLFGMPWCSRTVLVEAGPTYTRCTILVEVCNEVHKITERPNGLRDVAISTDCHEEHRYADTCEGTYPR